jgi:hypothetical protein
MPAVQGAFYVGTGLWPILHIRSFEAVTGPKRERWLVKTMGGLIAAVGASLIAGGREPKSSRLLPILGISSAVALAMADVIYVAKGRISPVYLADAVAELGLVAGWWAERERYS